MDGSGGSVDVGSAGTDVSGLQLIGRMVTAMIGPSITT